MSPFPRESIRQSTALRLRRFKAQRGGPAVPRSPATPGPTAANSAA